MLTKNRHVNSKCSLTVYINDSQSTECNSGSTVELSSHQLNDPLNLFVTHLQVLLKLKIN